MALQLPSISRHQPATIYIPIMTEPKIFDQNDEYLDASEPSKTHILQPPVLRINTNTITDMKRVLRERTNTLVLTTSNSSRACGRPRLPPICGSPTDSLRRQRRYSIAEQALEHALKSCTSERSPRELQILALEKATAALSTRAKVCLADRAVDPESYERRQFTADREVRQLSQHLASLKLKRGVPEQEGLTRIFQLHPSTTRQGAGLILLDFSNDPPRGHHYTSTITTFHPFDSVRRPASLGGSQHNMPVQNQLVVSHLFLQDAPANHLEIWVPSNAENSSTSLSQSSTPSSRLLPFNELTDDVMTSTRPSTPPLSIASTSSNGASHVSRVPSETPPQAPSGVATIYASSSPRSHTEILAELDKDSVRVPEYAVNLLEGFDLIHHDISLPERNLSLKPREEPAAEVSLPRPSEESDTGPYTSFALPPFQPDPLWSHTSLNTPSTPRSHVQTLHPLSSGSSTPSGLSTPTAARSPALPSRPHSLLFLMRKRKDLQYSPASSMANLDGDSARGSKRRFTLFTRK
ncbi:hypothetical protein EDB19DRAFT_1720963 [Suillus lakei]|nr:hypothetical protein EDB19DRAFT_1720963 [Suillus lakei]